MRTFANVFSRYRFAVLAALISVSVVCLFVRPNLAYAAGVDDETKFVFNTFSFLIWGALVMWMCAGFTMLESGSVRTKNASTICLKNIGIYSIAGIAYFVIGYNLMYVDIVGGFIGSFNLLYGSSADEIALLGGDAICHCSCCRERLLHHVGLVLPDGLRCDCRLHRIRHAG